LPEVDVAASRSAEVADAHAVSTAAEADARQPEPETEHADAVFLEGHFPRQLEPPSVGQVVRGCAGEAARQVQRRVPHRVEPRDARTGEGREDVERLVVHRREDLGGARLEQLALSFHRDAELLLRARPQRVAEGGELDGEGLVVPRDVDNRSEGGQRPVAHRGDAHRVAAAVLGLRGALHPHRVAPCDEPPALDDLPVADHLEQQLLSGEA
jgi:hypothetical protein